MERLFIQISDDHSDDDKSQFKKTDSYDWFCGPVLHLFYLKCISISVKLKIMVSVLNKFCSDCLKANNTPNRQIKRKYILIFKYHYGLIPEWWCAIQWEMIISTLIVTRADKMIRNAHGLILSYRQKKSEKCRFWLNLRFSKKWKALV